MRARVCERGFLCSRRRAFSAKPATEAPAPAGSKRALIQPIEETRKGLQRIRERGLSSLVGGLLGQAGELSVKPATAAPARRDRRRRAPGPSPTARGLGDGSALERSGLPP